MVVGLAVRFTVWPSAAPAVRRRIATASTAVFKVAVK
jgi:hypothetical protein